MNKIDKDVDRYVVARGARASDGGGVSGWIVLVFVDARNRYSDYIISNYSSEAIQSSESESAFFPFFPFLGDEASAFFLYKVISFS